MLGQERGREDSQLGQSDAGRTLDGGAALGRDAEQVLPTLHDEAPAAVGVEQVEEHKACQRRHGARDVSRCSEADPVPAGLQPWIGPDGIQRRTAARVDPTRSPPV